MITSDVLAQALPGRENAKDWLTMKIVECMANPMDEQIAGKLNTYNGAYNAICQWDEDEDIHDTRSGSDTGSGFSVDNAQEWVKKMDNADGTKGPHWTMEQAKQIMAQRKIGLDPLKYWVTLNMIYSDYSPVAKKHGLGGNLDFYADMAKAFLEDKDAQPEKLALYYKYIVK